MVCFKLFLSIALFSSCLTHLFLLFSISCYDISHFCFIFESFTVLLFMLCFSVPYIVRLKLLKIEGVALFNRFTEAWDRLRILLTCVECNMLQHHCPKILEMVFVVPYLATSVKWVQSTILCKSLRPVLHPPVSIPLPPA